MSRLNSKLVLKAENIKDPDDKTKIIAGFTIVKTQNTLDHGIPGATLTRKDVDLILKNARQRHASLGRLNVEFV